MDARFGAMQREVRRHLRGHRVPREPDSVSWHTRIVGSWDVGALTYLGLAWTLMAKSDAKLTRDHALSQDQT